MRFPFRKEHLPWGMAGARAALGPILIAGQSCNWSGLALASLVLTALLSDIFDGVLARRWQCDTAGVRLFDSMADTFFYLCVAIALWIGQPQIWHSNSSLICAVLAAEAARFAFDFAKFGTPASYHSWLAKTWGLLMAIAVIAAFASHHGALLIRASMIAGIVCNAETLTMSILLPVWRRDVPNLSQAWKIRREMLPLQPATMPPRLLSKSTRTSPRRQRQPSPSPLLSPAGVRQRPTPLRVNAPLELHRRLSRTGSALIRTGKTTAAPDPTVPRSHPGEKPPPPKRCNGQVHPTARSVDSFHARIPAIRSSLQPFVPSPCQNGKPQPHHTPKQPPARFTPQQEAWTHSMRESPQFDPRFNPFVPSPCQNGIPQRLPPVPRAKMGNPKSPHTPEAAPARFTPQQVAHSLTPHKSIQPGSARRSQSNAFRHRHDPIWKNLTAIVSAITNNSGFRHTCGQGAEADSNALPWNKSRSAEFGRRDGRDRSDRRFRAGRPAAKPHRLRPQCML